MIFNPTLASGKIKNVVLNPSYITKQVGSGVYVYSCNSDKCVAYFGAYDESTFIGVTKEGLLVYGGARFDGGSHVCTNSGMTITVNTNGYSYLPPWPIAIIAIEA